MKPVFLFTVLGLALFFSACGGIQKKIDRDPFGLKSGDISPLEYEEIARATALLEGRNAGLKTVKGIGNIKIYNDKESFQSRFAWIEDATQKIRMEFLGIDGRPVMSMAIDEKRLYAYSHHDKRFYTKKRSDNTLAQILSFELPLDVVSAILMGRVPLYAHGFARFLENVDGDGYVLSLLIKDSGDVERIFFNRDKTEVVMVEYYRSDESLVYRIIFTGNEKVQSYGFYPKISITDGHKTGFKMDIDRIWTDMPVDPSVFKLSAKEE